MRWTNLYRKMITNPLAYVHNRWINPSDRVIIKHPDYPQGHYHDSDTVMLYALFQLVVDYVEIECGNFLSTRFENGWQKWYRRFRELPLLNWLIPPTRNALRGLHHLRWEMALKDNSSQSEAAKELFQIYRFWKHTRLERADPFTAYHNLRDGKDWKGPISEQERVLLQEATALEELYEQEDTDMMQRIIKVRNCMWT
jgi:hypothetical protein